MPWRFFIIGLNLLVILISFPAQDIIHVIFPIAQWLGAANSCINPILYAFMNRKFRVGFKVGIDQMQKKIFQDYLENISSSPGPHWKNNYLIPSL